MLLGPVLVLLRASLPERQRVRAHSGATASDGCLRSMWASFSTESGSDGLGRAAWGGQQVCYSVGASTVPCVCGGRTLVGHHISEALLSRRSPNSSQPPNRGRLSSPTSWSTWRALSTNAVMMREILIAPASLAYLSGNAVARTLNSPATRSMGMRCSRVFACEPDHLPTSTLSTSLGNRRRV